MNSISSAGSENNLLTGMNCLQRLSVIHFFAYKDRDSGTMVLTIVCRGADFILTCRNYKAKGEAKSQALGSSRPMLGS